MSTTISALNPSLVFFHHYQIRITISTIQILFLLLIVKYEIIFWYLKLNAIFHISLNSVLLLNSVEQMPIPPNMK